MMDDHSHPASPEEDPLLSPPRYEDLQPLAHNRESRLDTEYDYEARSNYGSAEQEKSKSLLYLIILTLSMGGLQISWAVELSSMSPFLLSLGLSKALLSLVWIAGPLSGTLVQPYIGIKSDNCRSKWGRRKPFIAGGACATILSLLALAWTREIVGGFLSIFGVPRDSSTTATAQKIWAVLLIYVLDFAINVIQAGIRSFIVDCAPAHQQEKANAIANAHTGTGNIVGFLAGYVDLPGVFPFLGNTQFQALCALAGLAMVVTVAISFMIVRERNPREYGAPQTSASGVIDFFRTLFQSFRALPPQVRLVCIVQVFAWMGWFPFLFYTTTYIGGLYADPFFRDQPDMDDSQVDAILEKGTQYGTFGLLIFSITTLIASVVAPLLVTPTYASREEPSSNALSNGHDTLRANTGRSIFKRDSTLLTYNRVKQAMAAISLTIPGFTLRDAWFLSHLVFALLMWLTLFVRTSTSATVLVGFVGIPWAITNWAPYAFIAAEISQRDAIRRGLRSTQRNHDVSTDRSNSDEEVVDQAGIVLGIHNVAVAAPQVVATIVSSIIFKMLQKPRGSPDDFSVAWTLRFGGLCALVAAWYTRKVRRGEG